MLGMAISRICNHHNGARSGPASLAFVPQESRLAAPLGGLRKRLEFVMADDRAHPTAMTALAERSELKTNLLPSETANSASSERAPTDTTHDLSIRARAEPRQQSPLAVQGRALSYSALMPAALAIGHRCSISAR
jgi:hypothetical protein